MAGSSLLGELAGVVPRLVARTTAQVDLVRGVAARLPCLTALVGPAAAPAPVPATGHDDPPIDVLTLLAEPAPEGPDVDGAGDGDGPPADPEPPAGPVPAVEDLAVPDYDSLAASQVVPRLATLAPDELDAIARYEAANRGRRTILHRVDQLRRG